MAGSSTVVDLLIKAKDLASAPIRGIVASIKFLDSEISVVAGKVRDAFSGMFGGGLDGAMEFEAQLSKVAAKGDYTAAEMEALKKAATDIGAQFGVTGTEAAQGMEALAASGLNAAQVVQALPPVLALAKAEGLSMDAAAEKLSDSLATMGLGFDQAGRLANVLAKGANISTTSASALAEALATGGGIARDFGLSLEQTVGALAAFANNGIKGSAAGTALQAILTQLIDPSSQASKALAALGIETRDFGEVIGALKAKGAASNAAILAFGETAGPGLRALVKTGEQGLADLAGQLQNADGAAEKAASGIGDNLKGALSDLAAAWNNVKTALFDPVLEPLTRQAKDLAEALNTQLATGALKPVQDAIRAFADNAVQAGRDFVSGFDFKVALQSLQDFATAAKDSFAGIKDAGTTAASVVQIAWNGLTAGFKTIGASLLAVASSAVSNVAAIEEAASKVGLGSLQRATELKATAAELAAKAGEITRSIAQDGEDIRGAFDRLTASTGGAADGVNKVADAQQSVKDSNPAQEIQDISRSLADYRGMAERANAEAERSKQAFWDGKISIAALAEAADAAERANADLAAATERQTAAEQKANPERKKSALELESIAKASEDAAKRQGDYAAQLQKTGDAQADAIREEIALARAKGDTATAAVKTIELARVEADIARKVAEAKQQEAAELAKVVVARQAYLASVNGGTAAQQQELQTLQLKLQALQSEAAQAGTTAQAKALAAQQAALGNKLQADTQKEVTKELKLGEVTTDGYTKTQEGLVKHTNDGSAALKGLNDYLKKTREQIDGLSEASRAYFEQELFAALARQGVDGAYKQSLEATKAYSAGVNASRAALSGFATELNNANLLIAQSEEKLLFAGNGFRVWEAAIELAAGKAKKAFYEQAIAAENLRARIEDMTKSGTVEAGLLADAARAAAEDFNRLDEQDLSGLRGAIDDANAKLREMQAEAQSAQDRIAELNAEIAAEKGDTATADKLKLQLEQQQALAEIEAKLADARRAQNRELIALYEEQARKAKELYDLKERNLEQDQREQKQKQQTATGGTSASGGGTSASGAAPSKTYQLNLVGTGGKTITATTDSDPSAFLDALETAQRRSIN